MLQRQDQKKSHTVQVVAGVFFLTVAFYLLSFSGVPISDDEELYASAARNLAVNGTLSAEQVSGNLRLAGSYHGVEPAFPAVASLWYRLFLHSDFGHLQTLYLLPIFCTALSAALIVIIACQLGFQVVVGAAAALLYALSSMAWPYAKTLFREPLVSLILLGSLSVFLWLLRAGRRTWSTLLIGSLLLALLITLTLTRVVMIMAAVALFITLPLVHPALRHQRERLRLFAAGGLLLVLGLLIVLASFRATDADIFYRFTGSFVRDGLTRFRTISHAHLAEALLAPLFSPWKGLLFYAPVCILGLIALVRNVRRRPEISILPSLVLVALLLGQALAYDGEWWTPTWGSRFLLPVIPLLVVASLPILDHLISSGRGGWAILGGVFAAGFIIQLPAVAFNSSAFTAATYEEAPSTFPEAFIWNVARSPIISQWRAAASQEPDLLLWRSASGQPALVLLVYALALCLIVVAILYLRRAVVDEPRPRRNTAAFLGFSIVTLLVASGALLKAGAYDPAYQTREFSPLCSFIRDNIKPSEILIVQPYPGPAWQYLMNVECGQRVWYSLPYNDQPGSGTQTLQMAHDLIERAVPAGARYWLLEQFWSDSYDAAATSLAPSSDPRLQEHIFYSPFHMYIAAYARTQQP